MKSTTTAPQPKEYPPFAVRWSRTDCATMEKAGVLDYRYELVEGIIIKKMGQNKRHALGLTRAFGWLIGVFGMDYVQSQSSIDVAPEDNPTSEPEPDLVLLRVPLQDVVGMRPRPDDVRLLIEIADTARSYDLTTKARLYARAAIPEYWVLSLSDRTLYVHTEPRDGVYRVRTSHDETEIIAPRSATEAGVLISTLLPPPEMETGETETVASE